MINLYVNSVNLGDYLGDGAFVVNEIRGRGPIERTASSIEVPSMDGAHFRRVRSDVRVLEIDFTLKGNDIYDLRYLTDRMNGLINSGEPVPIRFSDEPTKTYYGLSVGNNDQSEVRSFGQGTLVFNCFDPYKYGEEEWKSFYNGEIAIVNEGNVETKPRFEIIAEKDLTHLDIIRKDTGEYMRLGSLASVDTNTYEPTELLVKENGESLAGWATASEVDNGYVAGEIDTTGKDFEPVAFGEPLEPLAWQGPSIKFGIGASLQDFTADMHVELLNSEGGTGMIEMYLLDIDNNVVAKAGIEDRWDSVAKTVAKFQLGEDGANRFNYSTEADKTEAWLDFDGVVRIVRDSRSGSNRIYPYFAVIDRVLDGGTGKHSWVRGAFKYTDHEAQYQTPITQVQIAMRKWPNTQEAGMKVKEVDVWRLNSAPSASDVPLLAKAGDRIVIDHDTEEITVNGESIKTKKEFGASFFTLSPGVTEIAISPSDAGSAIAYWRSKYR